MVLLVSIGNFTYLWLMADELDVAVVEEEKGDQMLVAICGKNVG